MSDQEEPREVTKEHVEQAIDYLAERGVMADTSPDLEDGRRSAIRWIATIREDGGLVQLQLEYSLDQEVSYVKKRTIEHIRAALKEVRRMESDIYRFAQEVHGLSRQEIDEHRKIANL